MLKNLSYSDLIYSFFRTFFITEKKNSPLVSFKKKDTIVANFYNRRKAQTPKLTLVGAGPGDAELITLKGVKALQSADVVLYDALVSEALLAHAPSHAIKIFVGKRAKNHAFTQDQINQMIVDNALAHGHVVRLKGGDPFVFGRGQEELAFAKNFNIQVDIVPGISSSYAVAELQGIPLTCRGINESFWVTTGTCTDGTISQDIYQAAQTNATVIILMGMNKLDQIVNIYKKLGKEDLPIAIIQNGSMPNEKIGVGTIKTIENIVKNQKIGAPAIIAIGEVVSLHHDFQKIKQRAQIQQDVCA